MDKALYFISDLHIRERTDPLEVFRQKRIISFLGAIANDAEELHIVGDLFDFWFDYGHVVPRRGGRVLAALADLVDSGVKVTCYGGNHDWWIGRSLTEEYGISVRHEPLWVNAQGQLLYVAHGDGLSYHDQYYRFVRWVLHNPLTVAAFRFLHPNIGAVAARITSGRSRYLGERETVEAQVSPVYRHTVPEIFAAGATIAVFGHVHTARLEATDRGVIAVLGEWTNLCTYGELRAGRFCLRSWDEQPLHRRMGENA